MSRRATRPLAVAATATILGGGLVGLSATAAHADAFSVATSDELVEAISDANASPGADVITFTSDITLEAHLPLITTDLEILGNGHTLDGDGSWTTLVSYDVDLAVTSLTIVAANDNGIEVEGGSLTLDDVTVTESGWNGVDLNEGDLIATGSSFDENYGEGIDAATDGIVTIADSSFTGNGDAGLNIEVWGGGHVELSSVVLDGNDWGGWFYAYNAATISVAGVVATGNDWEGIGFEADQGSMVAASGVQASANGDTGIYLYAYEGSRIELSDSSATANGNDGVYIDSYDSEIILTRVDAVGNDADGYDVDDFEGSVLTLTGSTIADNGDNGFEARDLYDSSAMTIDRSTIAGNATAGADLRLYEGSRLDIVNSTISGNGSGDDSCVAGIYFDGEEDTAFSLAHSTVYQNVSTEELCPQIGIPAGGTVDIDHSIISGTEWDLAVGGGDDQPDFTIEWSIVGVGEEPFVGTGGFVAAAALPDALASGTNLLGVDPGLEPLAANGGATATHLLSADSVALDAGDPALTGAPATDQRGELRIAGDAIDIGAVEMPAPEEDILPATGAQPVVALTASLLLLLLGGVLFAARRARLTPTRG